MLHNLLFVMVGLGCVVLPCTHLQRTGRPGLTRLLSFVYETHRLSTPWCKLLTHAVSSSGRLCKT